MRIVVLLGFCWLPIQAAWSADGPEELVDRLVKAVREKDREAQRELFLPASWDQPLLSGGKYVSGRRAVYKLSQLRGKFKRLSRMGIRPALARSRDGQRAALGVKPEDEKRYARHDPLYLLAYRNKVETESGQKGNSAWKLSGAAFSLDSALAYVVGPVPPPPDEKVAKLMEAFTQAAKSKDEKQAAALFSKRAWTWEGPQGGQALFKRALLSGADPVVLEVLPQRMLDPRDPPTGWAVVLEFMNKENRPRMRRHFLVVPGETGLRIVYTTRAEGVVAAFLARKFQPTIVVDELPQPADLKALADDLMDFASKGEQDQVRALFTEEKDFLWWWGKFIEIRQLQLEPRIEQVRANHLFGNGVFALMWVRPDGELTRGGEPIWLRCVKTPDGWRIAGTVGTTAQVHLWLSSEGNVFAQP